MSIRRWSTALGIVALLALGAFLFRPDPGKEQESATSRASGSNMPALLPSSATGLETTPNSKPHRDPRVHRVSPEDLIREKLSEIIIPKIDFEDITVEEAFDFLRQRSREGGEGPPEHQGFSFVMRKPRVDGGRSIDAELDAEGGLGNDPGGTTFSLQAENISFLEALDLVCAQAGMAWRIDGFAITIYRPTK